jgi:hypothetical protein
MITEQQFDIIEAQHHVTVAQLHVAKQRGIVARLTNDGRNTIEAQKQLAMLTKTLTVARAVLQKLLEAQI